MERTVGNHRAGDNCGCNWPKSHRKSRWYWRRRGPYPERRQGNHSQDILRRCHFICPWHPLIITVVNIPRTGWNNTEFPPDALLKYSFWDLLSHFACGLQPDNQTFFAYNLFPVSGLTVTVLISYPSRIRWRQLKGERWGLLQLPTKKVGAERQP